MATEPVAHAPLAHTLLRAAPALIQAPGSAPPDETFQNLLNQATSSSDSSKIADAAKQFEALMIGQILKTARESSDGSWLSTGEDHAGELAIELAEQQFAQAMSARGGLGIAKLVTDGLQRGAAKAASSGSPAADQTPTSTDSTK